MYKFISLAACLVNLGVLIAYLSSDYQLTPMTIGLWGVFTVLYFFNSFAKMFVEDTIRKKAKEKYNEIVTPILNNNGLTDEEKAEKIQAALKQDLQKQISELQ